MSGCTIDGNLGGFHADNGEFNLQNCTSVASILEEDQPSALSVNPGNLTVSDLTPSADNIAELSVRVPTAQAEVSLKILHKTNVIVIILQIIRKFKDTVKICSN